MALTKLLMKRGVIKTVGITIRDSDRNLVDCSSATFRLGFKDSKTDSSYTILVMDSSFEKSQAANGLVRAPIDARAIPVGIYTGDLLVVFSSGVNEDISRDIQLTVQKSVTYISTTTTTTTTT